MSQEFQDEIIHVEQQQNYAIISNQMLRDKRLSWEARGLLGYLLSLPHDWKIKVPHLIEQSPLGRDGVYTILRELRKFGYLTRTKFRKKDGTFGYHTVVREAPLPQATVTASPDTVVPDAVKPKTATPDTESPDHYVVRSNEVPREEVPREEVHTHTKSGVGEIQNSESPIAMEIRRICKRNTLALGALDRKALDDTMKGIALHGITLEQVQEFGRKVKFHWIGKGANTPKISQVLEYWQEVHDLPEEIITGANDANSSTGHSGAPAGARHYGAGQRNNDGGDRPRPKSRRQERIDYFAAKGIDIT